MAGAVMLMVVRALLAGVQVFVVLGWVLGKATEGLVWVVEMAVFLVQPPLVPPPLER